jgi:hypothetical protein
MGLSDLQNDALKRIQVSFPVKTPRPLERTLARHLVRSRVV